MDTAQTAVQKLRVSARQRWLWQTLLDEYERRGAGERLATKCAACYKEHWDEYKRRLAAWEDPGAEHEDSPASTGGLNPVGLVAHNLCHHHDLPVERHII